MSLTIFAINPQVLGLDKGGLFHFGSAPHSRMQMKAPCALLLFEAALMLTVLF